MGAFLEEYPKISKGTSDKYVWLFSLDIALSDDCCDCAKRRTIEVVTAEISLVEEVMSSNDHGYLSAKALDADPIAVTVLLCAYNEEAFLSRTLDTLLAQDARFPYEIVVVDNNSTDRTADVARGYNTRVVLCDVRGKIPPCESGSIIRLVRSSQ